MCVYVHKMADPKAKGSGHNYTGQTEVGVPQLTVSFFFSSSIN